MLKTTTILIGFSVVLNSCQSPSDEISEAFKTVNKSLEKSSGAIDSANNSLYRTLADKLNCNIKQKADSLFIYIQNIKEELKNYSSEKFPSNNEGEPLLEDMITSNKIMIENRKGDTMFIKMLDFNQAALTCDTSKEIKKEIAKIFEPGFFRNSNEFNKSNFKNTPTVAALTILSNFQNRIKNMLNILLTSITKQKGIGAFKKNNP